MTFHRSQQLALWLLTSLVLILTATQPARAQSFDKNKVHKVEAAYLYNFAKFIQWPHDVFESANSPFVIGVLGEKTFGRLLSKTVRSKKIAGRPIQIKHIQPSESGIQMALESCHMLYVASAEQQWLFSILASPTNRPVLLISDAKDFARTGGMIGFVLEKGRIVFEINRASLERVNLKASSKLMKLARLVNTTK